MAAEGEQPGWVRLNHVNALSTTETKKILLNHKYLVSLKLPAIYGNYQIYLHTQTASTPSNEPPESLFKSSRHVLVTVTPSLGAYSVMHV